MRGETLKSIAEEILQLFKSDPNFEQAISMQDYHGFEKGRIPADALHRIAEKYGVNLRELQAELVRVTQDLSHEIHMHKRSRAYCIVLGSERASAYLGREWLPVAAGDIIDIPPETMHGFTIAPGGNLLFLSVQTPPIEGVGGEDDYFKQA